MISTTLNFSQTVYSFTWALQLWTVCLVYPARNWRQISSLMYPEFNMEENVLKPDIQATINNAVAFIKPRCRLIAAYVVPMSGFFLFKNLLCWIQDAFMSYIWTRVNQQFHFTGIKGILFDHVIYTYFNNEFFNKWKEFHKITCRIRPIYLLNISRGVCSFLLVLYCHGINIEPLSPHIHLLRSKLKSSLELASCSCKYRLAQHTAVDDWLYWYYLQLQPQQNRSSTSASGSNNTNEFPM